MKSTWLTLLTCIIFISRPSITETAPDDGSQPSRGGVGNRLETLDDRMTKLKKEMQTIDPDYQVVFNWTDDPQCALYPYSADYYNEIKQKYGGSAKMIKLHLAFPEYVDNPLLSNASMNYRLDKWYRTFDRHGRTLLTLAFNYDIVSLNTLLFGVEAMEVNLLDEPRYCFGNLTDENKLKMVLNLTRADFRRQAPLEYSGFGSDPHVCHEVIEAVDEEDGKFTFRCCRQRYDGVTECTDNSMGIWVAIIYYLICIIKVLAFGFAPSFILWVVKGGSLKSTVYTVYLKKEHPQRLLITDTKHQGRCARKTDDDKYKSFKAITNSGKVPMNQIVPVTFKKIQLAVDQRRLMKQKSVPVGLFHYIFTNLFLCNIRKTKLFENCCTTSCCGSWSRMFLGCNLDRSCPDCGCGQRWPIWSSVAMITGGILLMFTIPIPYYFRLALYYNYEQDELLNRSEAMDALGLDYSHLFNILYYLPPTHGFLIFIYVVYFASFLLLGVMYKFYSELFTKIVLGAIQDMRKIDCGGCVRFLVTHILLPFEKFGVCLGLLVGVFYWPFVLIIFVCMLIFYSIPTIYLTFRFLKWTRPCPPDPRPGDVGRTYDDHGFSLEKRLFLDDISPKADIKKDGSGCIDDCLGRGDDGWEDQRMFAVALTISLLCIFCLWTVVILFGESFGFIVEILVFTMMGGIVNASSAAKYIMLSFWMIMYSTACYNSVYERYLELNSKIFELIGAKREEDIKQVILQGELEQRNTAFKYFNNNEECDCQKIALPHSKQTFSSDTLVNIGNQIHWRMNSLIFFINTKDVPWIPRKLFHEICQIKAPGCPGPIGKNLIQATRQFLYMVVFLFFVLIIVMAFGNAYKISSTNQMLVTLAGGFVPFIVRFVLKPKAAAICLKTYTFEGKIHQIIHKFNQDWPVFDLDFVVGEPSAEVPPDDEPSSAVNAGDITADYADEDETKGWNGVKDEEAIPLKEIITQPVGEDIPAPVLIPKCLYCARRVAC